MKRQKIFWIKNMVCKRCLKVIKQELEAAGVIVISLELGKLTVQTSEGTGIVPDQKVANVLHTNGFEIAKNEEEMLVERIKIVLIELITVLPVDMKKNTSEHLATLLYRDYKFLSRIFSKNEGVTIEKYFIKLKVEKAKELIQLQQYSFSEIAYLLDYSSVNHLSRQFRRINGMSMTEYKNGQIWNRIFFDEII